MSHSFCGSGIRIGSVGVLLRGPPEAAVIWRLVWGWRLHFQTGLAIGRNCWVPYMDLSIRVTWVSSAFPRANDPRKQDGKHGTFYNLASQVTPHHAHTIRELTHISPNACERGYIRTWIPGRDAHWSLQEGCIPHIVSTSQELFLSILASWDKIVTKMIPIYRCGNYNLEKLR